MQREGKPWRERANVAGEISFPGFQHGDVGAAPVGTGVPGCGFRVQYGERGRGGGGVGEVEPPSRW